MSCGTVSTTKSGRRLYCLCTAIHVHYSTQHTARPWILVSGTDYICGFDLYGCHATMSYL